ncbi:MAG TPA: O-antigen ligase family protein [Thermoanaerobaculia bacterium]|nr:O-antigen ligase family protein [Thermoanaerobaculia bacterium]
MAKKRGGPAPRSRSMPRQGNRQEKRPRDLSARIAAGSLAVAFLGAGLAVDSGADASFDAPKRLTALLFIGLAAAALSFSRWQNPFAREDFSSPRDWTLLLAGGALLWALFSAFLSPHRTLALDSTRALLLYALLLPIGASRALAKGGRFLLGTFLAVAAVNAVISILQSRGLYHPFALQTDPGSRESTGGFVGNVGYLAVALALAAVCALALVLSSRRFLVRATAAGGALLFAGGLLVNRNLTSLTALLAGSTILLLAIWGRRALLPVAGLVLTLVLAVAAYSPMRMRVLDSISAARAGDWNRVLTYRVGPWKAAMAMARERPLFGFGPGTFGAEYIPHRLNVEIESRRRYDNPLRTSSYSEAHCDYLQPFAEAGLPAGLAALGSVAFLFIGLARSLARRDWDHRQEAILLMAILGAGAAAALTWFPLQRPISSIPLLLAAGRAWRISGTPAGGQVQ